jgi:hypothetical protein
VLVDGGRSAPAVSSHHRRCLPWSACALRRIL